MNVLIAPNPLKKGSAEIVRAVTGFFDSEKVSYAIIDEEKDYPKGPFDLLLFIGGDGTLIHFAHYALHYDIPMIGINLGSRGYYCRIDKENIIEDLKALIDHEYQIEEHTIMQLCDPESSYQIINEAAFYADLTICNYEISLNKKIIYHSKASGILITTTIGSTGLNKSLGGAIIDNGLDLLEINPIATNTGYRTPLIIDAGKEYELHIDRDCNLSIDGQPKIKVKGKTTFSFKGLDRRLKLVKWY
ncbi:MAG: NAD(+)/NADH kinase [Erysipelotrichaceae bacterium]|nr:NAD(+)/NADH kinase [Erysipelotrichaceae bacterium]